jgi:hypothetical protein
MLIIILLSTKDRKIASITQVVGKVVVTSEATEEIRIQYSQLGIHHRPWPPV